jgi:rSAM/selenodomain-associated transferase 2
VIRLGRCRIVGYPLVMDLRTGLNFRITSRIACAGISVLALWLIFRRVDSAALLDALWRLKFFWFAAALLLFGLATLFVAIRWHIVLRLTRNVVHAGATFRIVVIGQMFNTLFFGPAGGDVAKAALYSRWSGYSTPSILATCFLDRLLGGAGFLPIAMLAPGLAALGNRSFLQNSMAPSASRVWILVALLLAALGVGLIVHRKFNGAAHMRKLIQTFLSGASQLWIDPRKALLGMLVSFLSHICMSSLLLLCLLAVTETPFSLRQIIWTLPAVSFISSVPITVAGTGLREGSALVLLGLYGIPAADAVAASLLVLLVQLLWTAIGAALLFREKRLASRLLTRRGHATEVRTTISVVIPTLNEAEALSETIHRARKVSEVVEIIVADGGSADTTAVIAAELGCRVIESPRGRGRQMREGSSQAKGDVVLLLHADTWLVPDAGQAIFNCLRDRTVVGGGFWKVFRNPSLLMAGSRFRCAVRLYAGGRLAGDQAMFVRRDVLEAIGGIPDMPLMEEFELCRRLRAVGRLALAGSTVTTSERRFAKLGVIRTYLRMWRVTLLYYLGTSAQKLQKLYERD